MFPILLFISASGSIVDIDSTNDYLVYYGSWGIEEVFRAKDFNLVILESSRISHEQVVGIKQGHDSELQTNDDVIVIGYLSVGEDHEGDRPGDGRGPCYWDSGGDSIIYENNGYASWYMDDMDHNGLPDQNGTWGSYYVNAGDSLWWEFIETAADTLINYKELDGLFLDCIDTSSPWFYYAWTAQGMSELIELLRNRYPDKYLIINRGLFYFDSTLSVYQYNPRVYINGVMFEGYYTSWDWESDTGIVSPWFNDNRNNWAPVVNNEANKPDGFTIFALDYLNPDQSDYTTLLDNQIWYTIQEQGWIDYISSVYLNEIRYDVFHHHPDGDRNPPTWNTTVGAKLAIPGYEEVTIEWNGASDQTLPVNFNMYYMADSFDIDSAAKLSHVTCSPGGTYDWKYTVNELSNGIKYYFVVRAEDSAEPAHEDLNQFVVSATPGEEAPPQIVIDGVFSDWEDVTQLDIPPNPIEILGDISDPDADLVDLWVIDDSSYLYFSYNVTGNIENSGSYWYHIFFDIDTNASTGFCIQDTASIGAEYMVENRWLYQYTGIGGSDWNWEYLSEIEYAKDSSRVELATPMSVIDLSLGDRVWLIFNVYTGAGVEEFAPDTFGSQYYSYLVTTGVEEYKPTINTVSLEVWPSVFSDRVTIQFEMDRGEMVSLSIYDVCGRRIKKLKNAYLPKGSYTIYWDGRDDKEERVESGVYFVKLTLPEVGKVAKIVKGGGIK
jgi:hypothetical protein